MGTTSSTTAVIKPLHVLTSQKDEPSVFDRFSVLQVCFSFDGEILVSLSTDRVQIHAVATGTLIKSIRLSNGRVPLSCCDMSHTKGHFALIGDTNGNVWLYDFSTRFLEHESENVSKSRTSIHFYTFKVCHHIVRSSVKCTSVRFARKDNWAVVSDWNKLIQVFDISTVLNDWNKKDLSFKPLFSFHSDTRFHSKFSNPILNGEYFVCDTYNEIRIYRIKSPQDIHFKAQNYCITDIAYLGVVKEYKNMAIFVTTRFVYCVSSILPY